MISSSILVRSAVPADVIDIRACAQAAYQYYIVRMNQSPAPMIADFDKLVSKEFVSIATSGNKLVGYVVCYPESDYMHLENVAVLPSHQQLGIGKKLIQHVERRAVAAGLTKVELYTNETMHENLAMYPKLGYVETNRKTQSGFNRVFFSKAV